MDHTLTCCLNGGARKAGWQTRVRHGSDDENLTAVRSRKGRRLTSLVNVSVNVDDDVSFWECPGCGRRGRKSWDKLEVEYWRVSVVGAVDALREDSEMVDSSTLTPTIVDCI